ncbi:MAG: hypothetical protein QOE19_3858 [Actinomycetota bacterium]|jgi:nucleotide-binding universal stress UspA family protein|nr:hypothetical protein [Actinomycetota bacterium]MDQ1664206.1 hypothetical protein [Actinomycetota bacterium]MDQ1671093.1 hypothetical protein [Actinomycetota bacterium]
MSDPNDAAGVERELIAVGVDGSEPSKRALSWAARQAERADADLQAVIAWEPPEVFGWMPPPAGWTTDFSADARRVLESSVTAVLGSDPRVPLTLQVLEGSPALVLDEISQRADLLVVGNKGRRALEEMFLGSVSLHCVFHAACPVTVVRPRRPVEGPSGPSTGTRS